MAVLTDTKARHIKPDDKPIPHGGVTGLTLHPSNTKGHGKWVLRFVSPMTGRRRNAGLGSYPAVGVAEAAKRALSMRELLNNGEDPLEAKATEKNGSDAVPTFEVAARTLHQELLPSWKNVKHGQQWINTLAEYAFPVLGSRVLNDIVRLTPNQNRSEVENFGF